MNEDKESDKLEEEVSKEFRNFIQKIFDPVFSVLDYWCWPITIALLAFQHFFGRISLWQATIFLWGPFAIFYGISTLILLAIYLFMLFASLKKFLLPVFRFLKIWFIGGSMPESKEGEDE